MRRRHQLLIGLSMLMVTSVTLASQVGIGLDFRKGLFLQEVWRDEKPYYLIANNTEQDEVIRVNSWSLEHGAGPRLAEWQIAANSSRVVSATRCVIEDYLELTTVRGARLGHLDSPRSGARTKNVASYAGLSGSGGRHFDAWIEGDLEAAPGERLDLTLHLRSGAGVLRLDRSEVLRYDGEPASSSPLPVARLVSASSTTLQVALDDRRVTVDATATDPSTVVHEVQLRYVVPEDATAPMVLFSGWLTRGPGRAHGLIRGIAVRPRGDKTSGAPTDR